MRRGPARRPSNGSPNRDGPWPTDYGRTARIQPSDRGVRRPSKVAKTMGNQTVVETYVATTPAIASQATERRPSWRVSASAANPSRLVADASAFDAVVWRRTIGIEPGP